MANTYRRMLLNTEIVSPSYSYVNKNKTSSSSSSSSSSYMSEANFDTNMVIILAALLCALICALGLNSIVRCALRCSRRLSLETPEQAAVRLALTGLKKKDLCQLPISIYDASVAVAVEDEPQVFVATECPICLGEFMDGEKVRVLPRCNHAFHVTCIDTWLLSHSSCPICRHSLLQSTFNTSSSSTAKQQQQQRLLLLQVTTTTTPQQTTTPPLPVPMPMPMPMPMPVI